MHISWYKFIDLEMYMFDYKILLQYIFNRQYDKKYLRVCSKVDKIIGYITSLNSCIVVLNKSE